jgi:hypothetical protein
MAQKAERSRLTGLAPALSGGIGAIGFWSGIGGRTVRFGMTPMMPPPFEKLKHTPSRVTNNVVRKLAIGGQLFEEREFGAMMRAILTDAGGRLAVCERRRQAIQAAYLRLRDPIPPVFDDARVCEELANLEERKIRLIHPLEQRLDAQTRNRCVPIFSGVIDDRPEDINCRFFRCGRYPRRRIIRAIGIVIYPGMTRVGQEILTLTT